MSNARLMKHNPAFLTEEELSASFVVRKSELDLIMKIIRENTGPVNQHIAIIAPRGMGKTMLAHRLALAVKSDASLNRDWYPVVLPEELYDVASQGELWLRVMRQIADQEKENDSFRMQNKYETLQTEKNERLLKAQSLAALSEFAGTKKLLVMVENLQMLLGEQSSDDDAWDLRHTLMNNSEIMLVTTATIYFGELINPEKANFELFREINLSPLSSADCRVLWQALTGENLEANRIRPMEILTGGSPRLLSILADFARGKTLEELLDNLVVLIDDHTTYFKANVETLPPKERRVFITLAELWEPSQAKQVADNCRLEINTTSSLLKRLVERGAVSQVDKEGRKHFYQISERLYNIYHLMRLSGRAADRVKALVRFMIPVYGEPSVACTLAREACRMIGDPRKSFVEGYRSILDETREKNLFDEIIKNTPAEFFKLEEAEDLHQFVQDQQSKFSAAQEKNYLFKGKQKIKTANNKALKKAFKLLMTGKYIEAIKIYDGLIEQFKGSEDREILIVVAHAYVNKGITFGARGKSEEAIRIFDEFIDQFKDSKDLEILIQVAGAYRNKGFAFGTMGQSEEAIRIYDELIERFKGSESRELLDQVAVAYNGKAYATYLLKNIIQVDDAIEAAEKAVSLFPNNNHYRHTLACLFGMKGIWEKAFEQVAFFANDKKIVETCPQDVIEFFMDAASAGQAEKALASLKGKLAETSMEPMIVALKIVAGIAFHSPQEVVAVAQDLLAKIKNRQRGL